MEEICRLTKCHNQCPRCHRSTVSVHTQAYRQRGQALIFLVILLPLLAILLNYFLQFLILLQTSKIKQKQCREQTVRAQQILIKGFKNLLALNPQAQTLRRRRQLALRALRAAPTPQARAVAAAYLANVELQQRALRLKQLTIKRWSRLQAKKQLSQIKGGKYLKLPPFTLVAKPALSITPSYFVPRNFEKLQEIIVPWVIMNSLKQKQEGQCGSYVKKRGTGFIAKIAFPGR